jgi:plastocyanin
MPTLRVAGALALTACSAFLPDVGPLRGTADLPEGATDGGAADGGRPVAPTTDAATDAAAPLDATPADAAVPSTFTVTVAPNGDHSFSPRDLTIRVGDTVHWVWDGSGHTVTSGTGGTADGNFCSPTGTSCGTAQTSGSGATYDHLFTTAGTFPYYCRPHRSAGMTGSITVQ